MVACLTTVKIRSYISEKSGGTMLSEDANYNNGAAVPAMNDILHDFKEKSGRLYKRYAVQQNLSYGSSPRETMDWFSCGDKQADILIFIHGGYWQSCTKDEFAFVAGPIVEAGLDCILLEYDLAPEVTLTHICAQIGRALDWIRNHLAESGKEPQRVFLSGHSAGGHLAALWQYHPLITATLPVSGIFDLEPMLHTSFNAKLQLTPKEIASLSPIQQIRDTANPLVVLYGADELPGLVTQSVYYYEAVRSADLPVYCQAIPHTNHFTVLEDVFAPEGSVLHFVRHNTL
ncbi:hypothetical protein AAG570_014061 [Ranatra chinensis]|uniref:Alpha/beta hydrolase fold-3 domain-containing protein n=1 Tax=Ranatra chinensis TaxID=642074 RepID=A0ABD0XS95_9HEMI